MAQYPQGVPYKRSFMMIQSADGKTGAPGKTPLVQISKAGGSLATAQGIVSEVGTGQYSIAMTAADLDTAGDLRYYITATGCDPTDFIDQVTAQGTAAAALVATASDVAIANRVLVAVGHDQVLTTLTDSATKKAERTIYRVYAALRDAEIAAHWWNFAKAETSISADSTAPAWRFPYRYALPTDFLQIITVNSYMPTQGQDDYITGDTSFYTISGTWIETVFPSPLPIEYIRRVTDATLFTPLFTQALVMRIAVEVCESLAQDTTKKSTLEQQYLKAVRDALRSNEIQEPPMNFTDDTWLASRISG